MRASHMRTSDETHTSRWNADFTRMKPTEVCTEVCTSRGKWWMCISSGEVPSSSGVKEGEEGSEEGRPSRTCP